MSRCAGHKERLLTFGLVVFGLAGGWPSPVVAAAGRLDADSAACQSCHGINDWQINDPVAGRTIYLSIDTTTFENSSHGSLACRTCHERGYDAAPPHRGSGRPALYSCVLCHEGDPALEWLHLPERKADLKESVHGNTDLGRMDCHDCHDPHAFRPINDSGDALLRIDQSNALCLRCHSSTSERRSRFAQQDVRSAHDTFPNYANHLRKVKCIACHTADTESTHHDVTGKDQAVRDCSSCHTPISLLLDVVYGPQRAEHSNSLREDVYVVGSSRSPMLERLGLILFTAVVGIVVLHGFARVVYTLRVRWRHED
ncbi:MAG: hypothetical protein GY910_01255 [bacterium]|nr:hypothetical protein [Deltaproteobacteria bacterium]MCP4903585.1 hypothetical protein [bacterium]